MPNWEIVELETKQQEGEHTKVVKAVRWVATATDGINETRLGGKTNLSPPVENFTPYENLTKEQVITWVTEALGVEQVSSIDDGLAAQLVYAINPPLVSLPLPWMNVGITGE